MIMKECQSVSQSVNTQTLEPPEFLEPVVDADDDDEYLVIGKRIPWIGWKSGFEQ